MSDRAVIENGVQQFAHHHALLIVGGSANARDACARDITASLFCETTAAPACGKCAGCKQFHTLGALFVQDIVPDGPHIYIEQIREAWETTALTSTAAVRVLRISQIERITREAEVMLLKRLEEPTPTLKFILTAARARHVLPTIRSRVAVLTLPGGEDMEGVERFHGFTEAATIAADSEDRAELVRTLSATLVHAHTKVLALAGQEATPVSSLAAGHACLEALASSIHDLEYSTVNARLAVEHAAAACAFLMGRE